MADEAGRDVGRDNGRHGEQREAGAPESANRADQTEDAKREPREFNSRNNAGLSLRKSAQIHHRPDDHGLHHEWRVARHGVGAHRGDGFDLAHTLRSHELPGPRLSNSPGRFACRAKFTGRVRVLHVTLYVVPINFNETAIRRAGC